MEKFCPGCRLPKSLDLFYKNKRGKYGRSSRCKVCWDARTKKRREANPSRERRRIHDTQMRTKQQAINAYGGRCACCGEDRLFFLSIDHVKGDGAAERNYHKAAGSSVYYRLKREGYPQDGRYQVLCHNCNMAKGTKAACPCRNPQTYMPEIKGQLSLF